MRILLVAAIALTGCQLDVDDDGQAQPRERQEAAPNGDAPRSQRSARGAEPDPAGKVGSATPTRTATPELTPGPTSNTPFTGLSAGSAAPPPPPPPGAVDRPSAPSHALREPPPPDAGARHPDANHDSDAGETDAADANGIPTEGHGGEASADPDAGRPAAVEGGAAPAAGEAKPAEVEGETNPATAEGQAGAGEAKPAAVVGEAKPTDDATPTDDDAKPAAGESDASPTAAAGEAKGAAGGGPESAATGEPDEALNADDSKGDIAAPKAEGGGPVQPSDAAGPTLPPALVNAPNAAPPNAPSVGDGNPPSGVAGKGADGLGGTADGAEAPRPAGPAAGEETPETRAPGAAPSTSDTDSDHDTTSGSGVLNILLLLGLIIAAFLTTHFIVRFAGRKWFLASPGLPYLVIGVLVGPAVFDIISASNLAKLQPAVMVGIGSIGLLAGLRLNFRRMRTLLEFEHIRSAGIIALFTALAVGLPACLLLARYVGAAWPNWSELRAGDISGLALLGPVAPAALLIIATALVSGTTPIQYTVERYKAKGWMSTFAIYVAEFSEVLGILMFSLVFAIANNGATFFGFVELDMLGWVVFQVAVGIIFGVLFTWFIGGDDAKEKLLVALLGIIVFSSGVAYFLRLSPLLITFVVGLVLANFSGFAERIRVRLEAVEKPFFIVIFLFAGMQLVPAMTWWSLLLIPGYALFRWGGKYVGGEVAFRTSQRGEHIIRGVGSALVSQGGLAVAMVLSYLQVVRSTPSVGSAMYQWTMAPGYVDHLHQGTTVSDVSSLHLVGNVIDPAVGITSIVTTVIVSCIIINDTFSFISTRNLLINAGEIDPDVDVVPEDIYAHPELNDLDLVPSESARHAADRKAEAAERARQPE
jgi:Kef-type K+ transport system membrane component KefB